ncbi:unnamed protein product [Owenia fusiformis]|uniref:Cadherin domain-containing protein n=1 Tax=Owenia fusiformis TaxID=6347 RepID=A0A8S4NYX6_OWEFU|nr:unnamed protein product [Owenia fusiformis]
MGMDKLVVFAVCCLVMISTATAQLGVCVQFNNNDFTGRTPLQLKELREDAPVGTLLRKFQPPSDEATGVIKYDTSIELEGTDASFFSFDQNTFELKLARPLNQKKTCTTKIRIPGYCNIRILGSESLLPFRFLIEIPLEEVNDHAPQFKQAFYVANIPEASPIGSDVITLFADDHDCSVANRRVSYLIQEAIPDNVFTINGLNGRMTLSKSVNYEIGPRTYTVAVSAQDGGDPPRASTTRLTVNIIDSDDQPPKFQYEEYKYQVVGAKPVNSGRGSPLYSAWPASLRAFDQDFGINQTIHYALDNIGRGVNGFFDIDTETGQLMQKQTVQKFNGAYPEFQLQVRGYQADRPSMSATTNVIVSVLDLNEDTPTFDPATYNARVTENMPVGTSVTTVTATDSDFGDNGVFEYQMTDPSGTFSVDPQSGVVRVANSFKLDREANERFTLYVTAQETKSVAKKVSDPVATVTVRLDDINDSPPVFSHDEYRAAINDKVPKGITILQMRATDADLYENGNGQISYSIQSGSPVDWKERFELGYDGTLRLAKSMGDLRRARLYPEYLLQVVAVDHPRNPANKKISVVPVYIKTLETNDYPPQFVGAPYDVDVSEIVSAGTSFTKLFASDADGDEEYILEYSIVSGNDDNTFNIQAGGWLVTQKPLDRETVPEYNLVVKVSDGKYDATADVHITIGDVNDNPPTFHNELYQFDVLENSPSGFVVGLVEATDMDNGTNAEIDYAIIFGDDAGIFKIHQNGMITVNGSIDKERDSRYDILILAADRGSPKTQGLTRVKIEVGDANDNSPVFSQEIYNGQIIEDDSDPQPNRTVQILPGISARDNDVDKVNRDIVFSLQGPNSELFRIDPQDGTVRVSELGVGRLDRDAHPTGKYSFQVVATDQNGEGRNTTAMLDIDIRDRNENGPILESNYRFRIPENIALGTSVYTVQALDQDATFPNHKIIYILKSGGHDVFQVDHHTGEITIADVPDRELRDQYTLTIIALDMGQPSLETTTTIDIEVVDVNDNKPEIEPAEFSVREELPKGTLVGNLKVKDPDQGASGELRLYTLENVPFVFNSDNGGIYTTKRLDREEKEEYKFTVWAQDAGNPPLSGSAEVKIKLIDINDSPPYFDQPDYRHSLSSNFAVGTLVSTPKGGDRSDTTQSTYTYDLLGDRADMFDINHRSGEVTVAKDLRELAGGSIALTLRITDDQDSNMYSDAKLQLDIFECR